MSFFKQILDREVSTVFLNLKEFAELQEFAGKSVPVISEFLELDAPVDSEQRPGVRYEGVTLHVSLLEVPDEILPGKRVTWRGETWWVLEADREALRTVRLYRERT